MGFGRTSHPTNAPRSLPRRIVGFLLTQSLVLLVFVGMPVGWTSFAPVTWLTLERQDERVSITARVCCLFFVPIRTERLDRFESVDSRFKAGEQGRRRSGGRTEEYRTEDQGFLLLTGDGREVELSVSPVDLDGTIELIEEFAADPNAKRLKIFTAANWKFSVFGGGLISLLLVIFLGALAFGLLQKSVSAIQAAMGVPVERRWLELYVRKAEADVRAGRV